MNGKVESEMGGQSEAQVEAGLECMSCGKDHRVWQSGAQGATHAVPIEDIGQLISSQLHVRPQLRPRPAHSHLAGGDCLKLEVPAAALHHVGFLCPEDAHPVPARLALHLTYKWGRAESERLGWWERPGKVRAFAGLGGKGQFLVLGKTWGISERQEGPTETSPPSLCSQSFTEELVTEALRKKVGSVTVMVWGEGSRLRSMVRIKG